MWFIILYTHNKLTITKTRLMSLVFFINFNYELNYLLLLIHDWFVLEKQTCF